MMNRLKFQILLLTASVFFIASCGYQKMEPELLQPILAKIKVNRVPFVHSVDYVMHQTIDTVLLGDMNGNGMPDTAFIYSPFYKREVPTSANSRDSCANDICESTVVFNFTNDSIFHDWSLGFIAFFPTEDLNNDGVREIAFVPSWFWSCWSNLYVYSLRNDEWQLMIKGSIYACNEDDFSKRIKKISNSKFEFTAAKWKEDAGMDTDTTIVFSSKSKLPIIF